MKQGYVREGQGLGQVRSGQGEVGARPSKGHTFLYCVISEDLMECLSVSV